MVKKIKVGRSLLETITVALYENPIILFREYVQNSLDAYNKSIDSDKKTINDFHVTINIDEKNRKIIIRDNGYGIETTKLFREKMLHIGDSSKDQDRTKYIGFRGIGRISGLPFCDKLIFRNKAQNSTKLNECIWEGDSYRRLLSKKSSDDLEAVIDKIVKFGEKDIANKTNSGHYFEVILDGYSPEINTMLKERNFREKLIRLLPLKYNKGFKEAKKIIDKYHGVMNEHLERFMISVKYEGKTLFKSYNKKYILGSKIIFWELTDKQKKNGAVGDPIGLLWFTFERHLKNNKNDEYYGILTRSKNILMGDNDTFAQVADNSGEYITTFREMAQALRGIYGELLINSQYLRDNSRRDWFLPDEHSVYLSTIISEFMRRLHNYRYCTSRFFRKNATKTEKDLEIALDELVDLKKNKIDLSRFFKKEEKKLRSQTIDNGNKEEVYSEQDMPHENETTKKHYDIIMKVIKGFFIKERQRALFLKLRAFIANKYKQE